MKCIRLNTSNSDISIQQPGDYVLYMYNFSGTCTVDIQVPDAHVSILGMFIGKKNDIFNINTVQRHSVGNSVSDLLIKGVFNDNAKFQYEGLIDIAMGAQKSNAYQKNQNLMLSNDVYVDSRPFLEIKANEVRCTHGSTTGKLDPHELLYLQTRGLENVQAQQLLIEGFVFDMCNRLTDLGVESEVIEEFRREMSEDLQ